MNYRLPKNSWELYLESVEKASAALSEILGGRPLGPLLNQFIHILVFQQGICAARWVNNNMELVRRLNAVQSFTKEEFEMLASEVRISIEKLGKL